MSVHYVIVYSKPYTNIDRNEATLVMMVYLLHSR